MGTEALPVRPSTDELLHALGHAVIATDMQGTVLFWNGAAEQLYGWPAAEAVGRDISDVTVPEVSQKAAAEIMAALREGRPWSGGFPVRRRGGEVLHALVTDSGVYRDGELIGIVGASLNLGEAVRHLMERSCDAAVLRRRAPCRQLRQPSGREPLRLAGRRGRGRTHHRAHPPRGPPCFREAAGRRPDPGGAGR